MRRTRTVAILRLREHGHAVAVGRALSDAGLDLMEVTLDHPDALDSVRDLVAALPAGAIVGVGTVRRADEVPAAAAAGARFCVSPHVDPAIIRAALEHGLEPMPGAGTATEVATALDAGARVLKLFPAGPLGPGYLRALLGPFRGTAFVPTGGIRHDDLAPWFDAGAVAVGLGSDLVAPAPGADDVAEVAARARTVMAQVQAASAPAP